MADRIKLRRGPKNNIDLNVYELGYVTDSNEERLYFNNGSMVPIPNNKDITDIKTELTETTNISNKNKQDVSELKESVAGIIKTGVAKLVQYSYDIELSENTKKVNIPYERYSSVTDTLKVYVNGLAIQNDQYTITDPVENEGIVTNGYIVLKVERPAGTIVRIEVWKNVPSGEEGGVSGNIIAKNSLPLDRIIGINDIRRNQNLLINGGFNINQRGKTNYTNGYTVDRWLLGSDTNAQLDVLDNGVRITVKSLGTWTNFSTKLDCSDFKHLVGKTLTLSFKLLTPTTKVKQIWSVCKNEENEHIYFTYGLINDNNFYKDGPISIISKTFTIDQIYSNGYIEFGIQVTENSGDSIEIEWAKLEIGDHPTQFVPRSYGEELDLCKRYYQKIDFRGRNFGANELVIYQNYPVEMRINPNCKIGVGNEDGKIDKYGVGSLELGNYSAICSNTSILNLRTDNVVFQDNYIYRGMAKLDAEIY